MMTLYPVSLFSGTTSTTPEVKRVSWASLCALLTSRSVRQDKDGRLFSPAFYPEGLKRADKNVESLSLLVLDFDNGMASGPLKKRWEAAGYAFIVYSSHSNADDFPKWRAVFPLAAPVPASEWPAAYKAMTLALGQGQIDESCKDISRMYYLPSCPAETKSCAFAYSVEGAALDPADFLPIETETPAPPVATTKEKPAPKRSANAQNGGEYGKGFPIPSEMMLRYGEIIAGYNERGDYSSILQFGGWQLVETKDGEEYWRRPGKNSGSSGTFGYGGGRHFVCFTDSAPPLRGGKTTYSPFDLACLFGAGGDIESCAEGLARQGFGTPREATAQRGDVATIDALISPSYCGDVATIQPEENAPDEIAEAVPQWILQLLGNLDAQVVDGRVCVSKNATARAIVGGIRRLWNTRNATVIQANYAMGVLAASLDGREAGASREDLIFTHFKNVECAEQIRRFVWVASQWSPTMIAQAIEKGFAWSNIVEASAKNFTIADRQRFMRERATVTAIRGEKAAKKGTQKYKTNAQLFRELESVLGAEEMRTKLLALFPQETEAGACGEIVSMPSCYNATNANSEVPIDNELSASEEGEFIFDTPDEEHTLVPPQEAPAQADAPPAPPAELLPLLSAAARGELPGGDYIARDLAGEIYPFGDMNRFVNRRVTNAPANPLMEYDLLRQCAELLAVQAAACGEWSRICPENRR